MKDNSRIPFKIGGIVFYNAMGAPYIIVSDVERSENNYGYYHAAVYCAAEHRHYESVWLQDLVSAPYIQKLNFTGSVPSFISLEQAFELRLRDEKEEIKKV